MTYAARSFALFVVVSFVTLLPPAAAWGQGSEAPADPGLAPPPPSPAPPAPVPAAPATPAAAARAPGAPLERGVVVATEYILGLTTLSNSGSGSVGATRSVVFQGSLFGGYKIDRVIVGLGLGLTRVELTTDGTGPQGPQASSTKATLFGLTPGVRVTALRSQDRRAELFGQLDLGWTTVSFDSTSSGSSSSGTTKNNGLTLQLGPGVRYWFHPNLSFFFLPLLRSTWSWTTATSPDGRSTATLGQGTTSIDADLGFLGVF